MTQTTSEKGYAVLKSFEGRALRAYLCPANVWTIGFGQTNHDIAAIRKELGNPNFTIGPGATITAEQADRLLKMSVTSRYEPAVRTAMKGKANQSQFDAGVSFHFNTGAIGRASWVKSFVAGNLAAAQPQLLAWNKGGGRVLQGLVRRRNREWAMVARGDYGPEGRLPPPVLSGPTGKVVGTVKDAPKGPGMLQAGDSGPEVAELQDTLKARGFDYAPDERGYFSKGTDAAVRRVQRAHPQLHVDGIVGPATRAALQRMKDVNTKAGTATVGGAVAEAGAGAVDAATGAGLPISVYIALGLVFAGTVGYFAWRYRDEIVAKAKAKFWE